MTSQPKSIPVDEKHKWSRKTYWDQIPKLMTYNSNNPSTLRETKEMGWGKEGNCWEVINIGPKTYHFIFISLNLLLCLHFCISSEFLFKVNSGSDCKINNFSDRHKSHLRVPHLQGDERLMISHLISQLGIGVFLFRLQM